MNNCCNNSNCDTSCIFSHCLHRLGDFLQPFLLLAIRIFWGYLLFTTGSAKLADLPGTTAFFETLHIPFSSFTAHFVAYVELISGICLMAGFATRLVSLLVIIVMLTAIFTAHANLAFYNTPPFPFFFASLILFCFGPGQISLDFIIHKLFGKKS